MQRAREVKLGDGQSRLRRTPTPPKTVAGELARKARYPHRIALQCQGANASLSYRRSRWHDIAEADVTVKKRETFCWISLGRQKIGALQFFEFSPSVLIQNDEFIDVMDMDMAADYALANVLCDTWECISEDVSDYGDILEFRMAWVSPNSAAPGLWAKAANQLVSEVFRDHSIMAMKAFPLEYEDNLREGSSTKDAFAHRQAAMVRYYEKLFGVQQFPGENGLEGWLWKPHPRLAKRFKRAEAA